MQNDLTATRGPTNRRFRFSPFVEYKRFSVGSYVQPVWKLPLPENHRGRLRAGLETHRR